MIVIVLVIVAAAAASVAFIPSLRRLSHRPRTGERELEAVSLGDAGEAHVGPGSHERHLLLHRAGERRVFGHRRAPDRSEEGVVYDPSEVERLVREQLYGPRNRRS